ncbi:MAG: radical SAM protein [Thermoprotei archaeon]|nr:MAG: radical SAM protein [Thermoprotei archaeon]
MLKADLFIELNDKNEVKVNYSKLKDATVEDFEEIAKKVRPLLMPKINKDYKLYLKHKPELREGEEFITYTLSACPECNSILRAVVFKRENKVWIRKVCPEHGEIEEIYFGDYELYERFRRHQHDGKGNEWTHVPLIAPCPYNCGLCPRHKSHPALINIVVTNRCDLSCFYCFFFASRAGYVYEPTLEHIRYMIRQARRLRPQPAIALQITGGEPTLRDDLVEIVKLAKEEGYTHVQVNTTGIRIAYEPELAKKLREAGTNVLYMSFDGVSPYTNPKNHWEVPYTLDNLRKAGLGVVLVPTIIKNYNLHEVGKIIRFGLKHNDIVRGVNIQPVSITGRMPRKQRDKERVTIPDVIIEIEKETGGQVSRYDWYPVPSVAPISRFIEAITGKPQLTLTTHFACGAATYVWQEDSELIPITRFVDVEGFLKYLDEKAEELEKGKNKYFVLLDLLVNLRKFVDINKAPKRLREGNKIVKMLYKIFIRHDYSSLGEFHYNALFLGMMHFQDLYNHDVARVMRCDIHYVMPDGREVPFCSFNVIPDLYRDRAQKAFSYSIKEWEALTGKKLIKTKYKRNIKKLISSETYRKHYEGIIDVDSIPYEDHVMASKKFGIPVIEE